MFMLCFSQLSCFHHTFADCESWLWQFESHVFEFWRVHLSSNSNQSISFLRCLRCVNLAILWNSGPFGNVSPIAPDRQFGNPIFVMVRHVRVSRTLQLSLVSKMKVNDPDRKSGSPIVMMVRHARVSRTFWSSHFLKMQVLHHIDVKTGLSLQLMVHLFSPRSLQPIVFRRVALQRERSPDPYSVPRRPFDLQWTFPICCTRISRTCIYCKLILRWKTAFTSSCLPCRGGPLCVWNPLSLMRTWVSVNKLIQTIHQMQGRAAPLAYCTQRSYCHWWEGETDHLPVPAEIWFWTVEQAAHFHAYMLLIWDYLRNQSFPLLSLLDWPGFWT